MALDSHKSGFNARRILRSDYPLLMQWFQHPEIRSTIEDEECSPRELKSKLDVLKKASPQQDGECALILEFDSEPIGFVHFMWINWISRTAEIDFFLVPGDPRPLLATLAVKKIAQIAFEEFNLHKLYGFTYGFNQRSLQLLGGWMKPEARLKRYLLRNGEAFDVHVSGILASDYFTHHRKRQPRAGVHA